MSDGTKIEWADATWNVVNGCSLSSPGCTNCYAMRLAGTRLRNHPSRAGLTVNTKAGPVWTGEVRFNEKVLTDPLRWRRPRRIFVCAHGDLFHPNVPDAWIDQVFAVMALASQHQFQVLTKRPDRMASYCDGITSANGAGRVVQLMEALKPSGLWNGNMHQATIELATRSRLPNVWLGTSVEDQTRADERIPHLLDTPAAVRWLSAEPLLGPINLGAIEFATKWGPGVIDALDHEDGPGIDWVVAGGESGPGARPMHPDWARSLRDQCATAGVPFLFKQWGNFAPTSDCNGPYMIPVGKKKAGRILDGAQHDGYPA